MSVQNTILAGIILWLILYACVYYTLYASHNPSRNTPLKVSDTPFDSKIKQQQNSTPGAESVTITDLHDSISNNNQDNQVFNSNSKYITLNPFVSPYCLNLIQSQQVIKNIATIIITYKDSTSTSKQELIQTIESVLKYSNGFLKKIIIVDDHNQQSIQNWPEWTSSSQLIINAYESNIITILRTEQSLEKAGAKNYGAAVAVKDLPISSGGGSNGFLSKKEDNNNILIFLEPFAIVSSNWISPLYDTLHKHSKALVYPSIDVIDNNKQRMYRSSNVVAGFDWSLQPRWEDLDVENKVVSGSLAAVGNSRNNKDADGNNNDSGSNSRLLGKSVRNKLVGNNGNTGVNIVDGDTATTSPATPSVFALTVNYYHEIGPFLSSLSPPVVATTATTVSGGSGSGTTVDMDVIEFSIRVWSCGGMILRQPCSRVAVAYTNFNTDITTNSNGDNSNSNSVELAVRKYDVDIAALSLANTWMNIQQTEYVFMSRFLHFIPYKVEIPIDSKSPTESNKILVKIKNQCSSFTWYLNEVYPGLITDSNELVSNYRDYLSSSNYETQLLKPLLNQYNINNNKEENKENNTPPYDEDMISVLKERANRPDEIKIFQMMQKYIPPVAIDKSLPNNNNNHIYIKNQQPVKTPQQIEDEKHEEHADRVRELLLCQDEDEEKIRAKLKQKLANNNANNNNINNNNNVAEGDIDDPFSCSSRAGVNLAGCNDENSRYYMIFGCPKTCQLCGNDGLLCVDFYEKKCKVWQAEGKCDSDSENMHRQCRITCGKCTRAVVSNSNNNNNNNDNNNNNNNNNRESSNAEPIVPVIQVLPLIYTHDSPLVVPLTLVVPVLPVIEGVTVQKEEEGDQFLNPYIAQRKFADGTLPDPVVDNACAVKGQADGQLLDRVTVVGPSAHEYNPNKIKVFCSIYTTASKHSSNVKATVETWGKKCDGFVAFSTEDDAQLPALKLTHEGAESWDNMWQKARSIWKYIAKRYINDFDYFLLGGDDMFYIVENLYYYLNTDHEIFTQNAAGKGLFLGRRFFPPKQQVFNSGGAGYILNKAAVILLMKNIDTPKCFPHQVGFWEDVNVANCLRVATTTTTSTNADAGVAGGVEIEASIVPYDTRDSLKRERFHPFTPGHHLQYRVPKNTPDWYVKYNPELQIGFDCCSDHSISFHYCPAPTLLSLHAYLYHCKK